MEIFGYSYETRAGTFGIVQSGDGEWVLWCDKESLGAYHTPEQALDDLVGGHCFWPSSGVDPSTLGIPDDFGDWEEIPFR